MLVRKYFTVFPIIFFKSGLKVPTNMKTELASSQLDCIFTMVSLHLAS